MSVLSGLLPQDHRVRFFYQLLPESVSLPPDLLPGAYQTAAFVSNMVLTDEALKIAERFDHYDDHVDQKEPSRDVFERNARDHRCGPALAARAARPAAPAVSLGALRRSALASLIDVASTILRFAGAQVPPELSAVDLRRPETIGPDRVVFAEATIESHQ